MKNKKTYKLIISGIFVLFFMSVIFYFSSQTADVSSGQSERFVSLFIKWFVKSFDQMTAVKQQQIRELLSSLIRECAHCAEFGLLGISIMTHFKYAQSDFKHSMLIGSVYAFSDEFHQLFVPGRAFQIGDLFIDCLGVFLGCGFVFLIIRHYEKHIRN